SMPLASTATWFQCLTHETGARGDDGGPPSPPPPPPQPTRLARRRAQLSAEILRGVFKTRPPGCSSCSEVSDRCETDGRRLRKLTRLGVGWQPKKRRAACAPGARSSGRARKRSLSRGLRRL